ncbi:MAG: CusA/CzcA family heavy metal efflux RND transporter [Muricauda sp.]|nr:CusA/CzcA family heavy metal efflux RND transporter [Allomuricauda sp.]MBO6531668.1 CusA/CzcA family heavy metal efflux RND transporter [Allomuricauda sp.]MBO6588206.1 CusA/CzcA family heavy metal efflux RND transporter [Allomuricauda sp.]MBO6617831.1 CusA/CzcA family heavy metal efflux RND transporter [Allomuricauda sp.]MBO6643158.1 CusA/CzcA family heavy metal efflux RND transporter [Allomuricauda sp.]MBO6746166.1 CusA/CzcA family heavy metal efflux RND transporter [Allomuricauda sp.]
MFSKIINFSIKNKFIVLLFTVAIALVGLYSLSQIPIGAVPDVTNNQVQVITTSRSLSTQDMEKFVTYPVELEMANLPGVKEIRSVSKFGLSVVTIVFEDDLGTFLPRQLIAEKIKSASSRIPEGFGTPEMGPITTGLGEIYQYILDVKPKYRDQYSSTELRTIQDWIVRRQLSGIPGVVEVNTCGGHLKQYEVAIQTQKLNAFNITAREVFTALEKNNSVTGGGYIEKVNQAYFIRGEGLVGNLKDIENIVVTARDGIPIYIKDVAKVGFGSAPRFGAITGNGEGEKVLGQIMMLKDADSKRVIEAVKERVAAISKSLPEGVYINPFLDRSELIGRTTFTVTENLVLGCLIVIFVVVLLLGNWRSGLVVASVIPLCLLFALTLMNIFGVDANLLSLGAIDFGIIIDGAVIIVEYIAFQITRRQGELVDLGKDATQSIKDKITVEGATKMMNSAVFGQLIILIVFIPILSLSGVEGKMFKPMALTFSFALLGAILLCFTYVPVASALFLKPSKESSKNISARLVNWINKQYEPVIEWAMKSKKLVLSIAAALLAGAIILFSSMGGEFVPTLDEGDFVIQPVLKTGTSLAKTVEMTTKIEKILMEQFPEVNQVVSRIGAAEVPTDPMSMEESDVIISLKPKSEWTSAETKDELADKFKEALSVIPGMEVEFTQPIEMRFNELITGVRADIAIKIFGENLETLSKKADEIKDLIQDVEGASDIIVEKVEGLPQMNVAFDRAKIARHGLNIADLNEMISMGFAGKVVGSVFEGERQFDLAVRLDSENRQDISNLRNLYVDIPNGGKIPMSELAEITYQKGAAKISRDDTKRRIVVGINVRNRDLQSVVDDIQLLVRDNITLPPGYLITYGGQFENLQNAKARLMIAVPIALLLIFIMLYFAFGSVKEALLIFSAIPLSAVGGVLLLWLRDMPFSISAGVGFIALFGIAVLNGIVLIEHFKELKGKDFDSMEDLIKQGTKDRLRAVLLTASAAALGFLPMAVSTNAGAEVQRPLATVVIGGLVTATMLTLVVLPVLYAYSHHIKFRGMGKRRRARKMKKKALTILLFMVSLSGFSQQKLNLEDLMALSLENNKGIQAGSMMVNQAETLKGTAFEFNKTDIYYQYDENNLAINNQPIRVFGVQQQFEFPTVYGAKNRLQQSNYELQKSSFEIQKKQLYQALSNAYYQYQTLNQKAKLYKTLDSIYSKFAHAADRRFELGETNYLEKVTATAKQRQIANTFAKINQQLLTTYGQIASLVQTGDSLQIATEMPEKLAVVNLQGMMPTETSFLDHRQQLSNAQKSLEENRLLPDLNLEYFQGTNSGLGASLYGLQVGVRVPIFFFGHSSKVKSSKIQTKITEMENTEISIAMNQRYKTLMGQLEQQAKELSYYEDEGGLLSDQILKAASGNFQNGEIDFFQYIQSLENAYEIQLNYLDVLNQYNQTVIAINYLTITL